MTRPWETQSHRIARWIPRGFLLGTVLAGGTLLPAEESLAAGGFPSLFRKPASASDASTSDAVAEIRKLMADAGAAARQKDYAAAVRLAERAQKLALTNPSVVGSALDCAPSQITTTLQQYRLARAGNDVRLSLDSTPKPGAAGHMKTRAAVPPLRPGAPAAAERPSVSEIRSGSTAAPIGKMLARPDRTSAAQPTPATASRPQPVVKARPAAKPEVATPAAGRTEPKLVTGLRPATTGAPASAAVLEIRREFEAPLTSWNPTITGPVVRDDQTAGAPARQRGSEVLAGLAPEEPRTKSTTTQTEQNSPAGPPDERIVSTRVSGIDPTLTERLLKPLSGLQVQLQDGSEFDPTETVANFEASASEVEAPVEEGDSVVDFETVEPEAVAVASPTAEFVVDEPIGETPSADNPPTFAADVGAASKVLATLPPVYEVRTAEAVRGTVEFVEQISDEQPAPPADSVEVVPPSAVVRHLEWSPVVESAARTADSNEAVQAPTVSFADAVDLESNAPDIEEPSSVEQAGFRGRDESSAGDRRGAARRQSIEDEDAGPFVVFREPGTSARPAWEVAPAPPVDSSAVVVNSAGPKAGMPRDALWWFSTAGILLGGLGLGSLLPRRQ